MYIRSLSSALFAVVIFSLTAPITKYALTSMSAELLTTSRLMIAGIAALFWVSWKELRFPDKSEMLWLMIAGAGVILGFPYLLALSLETVDAATVGIVLAGLPLCTTLLATVILQERYSATFWLFSLAGALVLGSYMALSGQETNSSLTNSTDIFLLLTAMLILGGLGYSAGVRASRTLGGWNAICWMLVLYLPVSAITFGYAAGHSQPPEWHPELITVPVMTALMYLALFSQWWGFRFWYQSMADLGAGAVSQVQLLQPFFTLAFAALLLREDITFSQVGFAVVIVAIVYGSLWHSRRKQSKQNCLIPSGVRTANRIAH